MKKNLLSSIAVVCFSFSIYAQQFDQEAQQHDPDYIRLKEEIIALFKNASPGKFGEFVKGVDEDIITHKKILALTFDACGGPHGSGYDSTLIEYLKRQKIPATLFITGLWIDTNPDKFDKLVHEPLFEIENHGLTHHPCAIAGESMYGIPGTGNVSHAVDEIELNARKIELITHRKPIFYRSATATTDEGCTKIARILNETIISFDILSGDAVANTPIKVIKKNIASQAKDGAIIIMHMNHPEWNGFEALQKVVPILRKEGYSFVKLEDHPLKGR